MHMQKFIEIGSSLLKLFKIKLVTFLRHSACSYYYAMSVLCTRIYL